jgi:hypothetical protein
MLAVVITTLFPEKGKKPSILYLSLDNSESGSLYPVERLIAGCYGRN